MAATPETLFHRLDALGIRHATHQHPPLLTVAEAVALRGALPGGHCKMPLPRGPQGRAVARRRAGGSPARSEGAGRPAGRAALFLRRARAMREMLGVDPGQRHALCARSTPSAASSRSCSTQEMLRFDPLNYHPLVNTATTAIAPGDLQRFIADCGPCAGASSALAGLDRAGGSEPLRRACQRRPGRHV